MKEVALARIAHGRSGDKGDTVNCGIIARKPEYYSVIKEQVTTARVREHFGIFCRGTVIRYDLPKIHAFNFVLTHALGGGGTVSLRRLGAHESSGAGRLGGLMPAAGSWPLSDIYAELSPIST